MKNVITILLFIAIFQTGFAQYGPFKYESSDWGDYDNDGDLDFLISSTTQDINYNIIGLTSIYINDNGTLNATSTNIASFGEVLWIDFDQDDDLDFILGSTLYENNSGTFSNAGAIQNGNRGDFDNDGDLDILYDETVYENNGDGTYQTINIDPSNVIGPEDFGRRPINASDWVDFDNDGDLDIIITGFGSVDVGKTILIQNNGGVFEHLNSGIQGYYWASFDWGDYDDDGDLDLAITGVEYIDSNSDWVTSFTIYENQDGTFVSSFFYDGYARLGYVKWADTDSDGDLDVMITGTGTTTFGAKSAVFYNSGGSFVESIEVFPLSTFSPNALDIVDRLNNGHLEVYIGSDVGDYYSANFEFVDFADIGPNTPPLPPQNIYETTSIGSVHLSWDSGSDQESNSLYYNIQVRTTLGPVIQAFSNSSGERKIADFGNMGTKKEITLNLPPGEYFWSVQSIDNGFRSSAFSVESSFNIIDPVQEIFSGGTLGYEKILWADLNNDNFLDIVTSKPNSVDVWLYENGTFTSSLMTDQNGGNFQILDYDKNNFNDVLMSDEIYLNDGNSFQKANAIIPNGSVWSDFNNDGDFDLFGFTTLNNVSPSAVQYLSGPTGFVINDITVPINLYGEVVSSGSGVIPMMFYSNIIPFNKKLLIPGKGGNPFDPNYDYNNHITLYNEDGGYDTTKPVFTNEDFDHVDVGDYDNDGDYDVLVSADNSTVGGVIIRDNGIGSYTTKLIGDISDIGIVSKFADINIDGFLDVLTNTGTGLKLYLNTGGTFIDAGIDFGGISATDFAIADYDRDGDLDIAVIGSYGLKIFKNNIEAKNSAPAPPNTLSEVLDVGNAKVTMTWNDGSDTNTPVAALQYNLDVRLNNQLVVTSHAADDGTLSLGKYTNMFTNKSYTLNGLSHGKYTWKVQTIDNGQLGSPFSTEQIFYINEAPTDISLSKAIASESLVAGTLIGTFTTTDPDASDTFVYSFVTGENDNSFFNIVNDELQSNGSFDFETQKSLTINVQSYDSLDGYFAKEFTISITDANDPPQDILLNTVVFSENLVVGSEIITLSSVDPDTLDTHTYALVAGEGDTNNDLFSITDNKIHTDTLFDFETASLFTIRIETKDQAGAVFSKKFSLNVIDANDPPTDISLSNSDVLENQVVGTIVGLFTSTDIDTGETFTYSLPTDTAYADNSQFSIDNDQLLSATIFQRSIKDTYTVLVRSTDSKSAIFEKEFVITVLVDPNATVSQLSINNLSYSTTQLFTDDQDITFSIEGGKEPYNIIFKQKGILDNVFSTVEIPSVSTNNYSITISKSMLDDLGVDFSVEVSDVIANTDLKSGKIHIAFNESQSPDLSFELYGGSANDWNLFSIPYDLDNKAASTMFAEYPADRHLYDWKIVRYSNSANTYLPFNTGQVKLGEAYWFNAKESKPINLGAGKVTAQIPFNLPLLKGWNLIGNPYPVAISWNQVLTDNPTATGVGNLQIFNGIQQASGDVINPFGGGFVFAAEATSISIDPVTSKTGGRISSRRGEIDSEDIDWQEWQLDISLVNNDITEVKGGIGMHPDAHLLNDQYDAMAVPRFFTYTDLFTQHDDYFYPWFQKDVVPTKSNHTWSFSIETNKELGSTILKWNQTAIKNAKASLFLLDKQSGKLIDMKAQRSHPIIITGGIYDFEIYYSTEDDLLLPKNLILGTAYPNPANTTATIPVVLPAGNGDKKISLAVYDINGKHITTLAEGVYAPGIYEFTWDISKDSQQNISGMFIYRLLIADGNIPPMQKKLIVR